MAAQDLCTLADVRSFLQKPAVDTAQDTLINSLITRASDLILHHTSRQFAPAESAAAKTFAYYGGPMLNVAPYDLRTVTSVVLDTDQAAASQTTLASNDYRLRPKPARNGTYLWLKLVNHATTVVSETGDREITVTGNWGFATVPTDVAHWCIVTVGTWLRRDVTVFEATFNLDEQALERPLALPSAVRAGLAHYKRITPP